MLPALGGLETVRTAIRAWDEQRRGDELEVLVLCPDAVPDEETWLRRVDSTGLLLHEARGRGIREARADAVFLAEDHCVPDRGWSDAVLARLAGDRHALGCALRPGDAASARSQATFLLGYGEWMPPVTSGPARALPGHNVVLRRQPLLDLGPELDDLLLVSAFLVRRLLRSGRGTLEPGATMRHYDVGAFRDQLRVFETVGRSFGAARTRDRPRAARALHALLLPLVAAAHWRRAFVHYRRAGRANGLRPACLLPVALFALVWAWGEAAGALLGPDRIVHSAWMSETKPLAADRLGENA